MANVSDLKPGEQGMVISVKSEGALRRRIVDMGITPGTVVYMKKSAPLGDPIEILLRGYALSIRRSEAEQILIERFGHEDGGRD